MLPSPRNLPKLFLALAIGLFLCPAARAEVAHLRNGRSIQVTGFRLDGDRVVLQVDGGGEMILPAGDVLEIRRQPAEAPPVVAPAPRPGTPPPDAAIPAPPSPPAAAARIGADEPLLPVGGVFDPAALRSMAARIARRHGVDESLVQAVIEVESRYDAFAVSPRGAMGLMQLMPRTAVRFDVDDAFDPVENVDGGVRYLKQLLDRYSGQVRLALAAYNAGEEAVERHSGIPPYRETIDYVRRVMVAARR